VLADREEGDAVGGRAEVWADGGDDCVERRVVGGAYFYGCEKGVQESLQEDGRDGAEKVHGFVPIIVGRIYRLYPGSVGIHRDSIAMSLLIQVKRALGSNNWRQITINENMKEYERDDALGAPCDSRM
jgi:hypothetical protein